MLNSKPNNKKYHQGNYRPKNRDKIVKMNSEGGVYFRSGLEQRFMVYLDMNDNVKKWGAECLKISYQKMNPSSGALKQHTYYPDFYYELRGSDGVLKQVVVEVKPMKEYITVQMLMENKLKVPESGLKKLRNFEYDLKMAHTNRSKWEAMIKWCDKKGYKFIIITEDHLKQYGV